MDPNPLAPVGAQVWRAHGERMTVGPPTSIVASQCAIGAGTPRRVQLISTAPRGTESKARRMSQLDEVPERDETGVGIGADRCRPSLDHIIGEPRGPWGGAAAVAGDDAVEFSQCWGGSELGGEVAADQVHARDVRESLPEEAAEVCGDAAMGCVFEKGGTIL